MAQIGRLDFRKPSFQSGCIVEIFFAIQRDVFPVTDDYFLLKKEKHRMEMKYIMS